MLISLFLINGVVIGFASKFQDGASYLIAMRVLQAVTAYIQIPFMVKLPVLSEKYRAGNFFVVSQILSQQKLIISAVIFCIAAISIFGSAQLQSFDDFTFVKIDIWLAMLCALIVERIGAINIQTHSLSNNVDWHYANGGFAIVFLLVFFILNGAFGLLTIPASSLIAYLVWYYPFSTHRSHSVLPEMNFLGDFVALLLLFVVGGFSIFFALSGPP